MTIKELKEILDKYPDDYKVYVWSDHGQDFESLSDYCAGHIVNREEMWIKDDCDTCMDDDAEKVFKDGNYMLMCLDCRFFHLKEDSLVLYGE